MDKDKGILWLVVKLNKPLTRPNELSVLRTAKV